ncbi:MAG: ABC transporter permease [Fastidiosipila sp.]|nr:ABC transporter permease [Fastidiosipila sp.]
MTNNIGRKNIKLDKKKGLGGSIKRSNMTAVLVVLILLILIASVASRYFLDIYNIQALLRDLSFVGMIAVGQSMLLLVGELDLSVGKIASLTGIVTGMMMVYGGWNSWLSLLLGLVFGTLLGILNGIIITKLRLNSMVATIGMQGVYGGINLVLTRGKAITNIPEEIQFLGKGNIGPIPIPFIFTIVILILVVAFVKKTKTGRHIYAIGNNREVAKILGIKVDQNRVLIYAMVGFISALAGLLYMARLGSSQSTVGESWPMNSIAASVIGGVSLSGGIGNPAGALIGAAIIALIQNMIVLFGVNVYWQSAVSGFVVVIAISFSSMTEIWREKQGQKRVQRRMAAEETETKDVKVE